MFTKNWYKALGAMLLYKSVPQSVNYNGTTAQGSHYYNNASYMFQLAQKQDTPYCTSMHYMRTAINSGGGVILGTGTTPATMDDYKLSGDIVTGYTYSTTVSTSYDENGTTVTGVYTISNNNSNDITIGEIGLICANENSVAASSKLLLERTVLEAPITIPAGRVGQITYTITFTYPTA